MFDAPARILPLKIEKGRRILTVSDIHGNLPYLKGLLKKAAFSGDDELIIDGDFLEKGGDSLGTLRYIMELSRQGNVHTLCGNCDGWIDIFTQDAERDDRTLRYMMWKKSGLLWDMCNSAGIDPFELEDFGQCKKELFTRFLPEWEFLARLPHAIETEHYIFAHASVTPGKPLRQHLEGDLTRCDAFMRQDVQFSKWVIVGHYPVMLYGEKTVCANPIIDREKHIISIDGGCVLKDDGQLNALVIPFEGSEDFSWLAFDPFPVCTVLDAQAEGPHSYYIRWGDSRVQVLQRGPRVLPLPPCAHRLRDGHPDKIPFYRRGIHRLQRLHGLHPPPAPRRQGGAGGKDLKGLFREAQRGIRLVLRGFGAKLWLRDLNFYPFQKRIWKSGAGGGTTFCWSPAMRMWTIPASARR